MKKQYRKPLAKYVDFSYDEQINATSVPAYCDQGWKHMTTLIPQMRTTDCVRCFDTLIWIDSTAPVL